VIIRLVLLCAFSVLCSPIVTAGTSLYEQSLLVEDRTEDTREQAMEQAFKSLLHARTGTTGKLPTKVSNLMKAKSDYIDNYAYSTSEMGDIYLNVLFSQSLLDSSLREAGAVIMPKDMPKVLALFAIHRSGGAGRELIADDGSEEAEALKSRFKEFGLDVKLPDWGLRDLVVISEDEIWRHDLVKSEQLAEQYGYDCFVVGGGYQDSMGRWRGSWESSCGNLTQKTPVVTATLNDFVSFPRNLIVDQMKRQHGVNLGSSLQSFAMTVHSVDSYAQYRQLSDYLASMQQVKSLEVESLANDSLVFHISLFDSPTKLLNRLQHDGLLEYVGVGEFNWIAKKEQVDSSGSGDA